MYKTYGYSGEKWCCYFHFIGWLNLSIGVSVHIGIPNIEIHLPGGFIRVGRTWESRYAKKHRIAELDLEDMLSRIAQENLHAES